MSDVKWFKIKTNIFDDEKIKFIETLPDSDTIIVIWFKILALTAKSNNDGFIMLTETIPYTEEMLISYIGRKSSVVKSAVATFEKLGMIEITDENAILVSNWNKHQNVKGLEMIRKQNRERQQRFRDKNKALEYKELEKEKEEEIDIDTSNVKNNVTNNVTQSIDYQSLVDYFNGKDTSWAKIRKLSNARRNKLKLRIEETSEEDFKKAIDIASETEFLKGNNENAWNFSFDWLIKNDTNIQKVLEGKYGEPKNKKRKRQLDSDFPYDTPI